MRLKVAELILRHAQAVLDGDNAKANATAAEAQETLPEAEWEAFSAVHHGLLDAKHSAEDLCQCGWPLGDERFHPDGHPFRATGERRERWRQS